MTGRPRPRRPARATSSGSAASAASPTSSGPRRRERPRPGRRSASPAVGARPARGDGSASEGEAGFGWLEAIGVGSSAGLGRSHRRVARVGGGRLAAQHTRPANPPSAERRARAASDGRVTAAATTNRPTMIEAASRDAHASSASTTNGSRSGRSRSASGMNCRYGVGRGVDLVGQPVDRRRAVGGQDRQPDRHPDHPGDGDDRRGDAEARADRPPRPPRSSAA